MKSRHRSALLLAAAAACSLLFAACPNPVTERTAAEATANGWDMYKVHDYTNALNSFEEAIGLDASYVDAYNGAGWTTARMNDLNSAVSHYTNGLRHDNANLEIQAGLAFVYNARKSYPLSIDAANAVLTGDANWTFSHDTTINAADIRLLLAENYFAQGEYGLSRDEVHLLDATVPADLDITTATGIGILARAIERLRSTL